MSQQAASFFGDDWDDVLDGLPTLVRPRSDSCVSNVEAIVANENPKRPTSGIWIKRDDALELPIPLAVRWIDPHDILEELQLDPCPVIPPANHTMEILPWDDIEIVEDSTHLQELLKPPSLYAPLPVLPVRTSKPIPQAVLFAAAILIGFVCAGVGFFGVVSLFG